MGYKVDGVPRVTREQIAKKHAALRNWGRWGEDDEAGTLNLATPELIVEAMKLVRRGATFSLAMGLGKGGPQRGNPPGRFNPLYMMYASGVDSMAGRQAVKTAQYADDLFIGPLHAGTHWDSLAHIFFEDEMYNGYPIALSSSSGAEKCGIDTQASRHVGRGVLLDLARFHGTEVLEDGFAITSEDLDACAAQQGVEVRAGDFLLFRTGQLGERIRTEWGEYAGGDAPGLAFETLDWIRSKDIAAIASDTWGVEVRPNESDEDEVAIQPWHHVAIPAIGLAVGEIFALDELAADCEDDGCWEFLFVALPLPVTGASGALVHPVAIK
jgi:kynurenine formamidase